MISKLTTLAKERRQELVRFAKFCVVGVIGTIIDFSLFNLLYKVLNPLAAQPAYNGAIPTVLAAAGEEAEPGHYYGPTKLGEARGPVGDARIARHARDEKVARRLWEESERLVGFDWGI